MKRLFTGVPCGRLFTSLLLTLALTGAAWAIQPTPVADAGVPDPAGVKLYGVLDAGNNSSQIFKILNDGTYVTLGPVLVGIDLEGLDMSPLTGELYAITASGTFAGNFYKVDKDTGAVTLIGNTGLTELQALSFHPVTGELWAYKHLFGLYKIDLNTAVATFQYVPAGTGVFKTWEGLAWDNEGVWLYGENRTILYRTDPTTHNTQILCTTLTGGEGLDFAPDGTLYAGLDPNDPADLRIFKIDYGSCTTSPSGFNLPLGDVESITFVAGPGCSGEIGDYVWTDLNGDGLQGASETGIAGATVHLKNQAGDTLATATTDAAGGYLFSNLCAGDYVVEVDAATLPPGLGPSLCNFGSDDTIDNDCSPASVNLPTDSTSDTTVDFGFAPNCDDQNACTTETYEPASGCVYTPVNCDDANVCTADDCNPEFGCTHILTGTDDGDACTEDDCNPSTGEVHHTPISCDDGVPCTTDSCDPASGCHNVAGGCDDGNACTDDSCDAVTGACTHTAVVVEDGNLCTIDSCDPATGIHHEPLNCDNGNACNDDACDPASGCTHIVIDCNDHNECTNDSCDPATGCVYSTVVCNDSNACTDDACDPSSGCSFTLVDCHDDNICTDDSCSPDTGCAHAPVSCDDANACTVDSCDPVSGCTHTPGDGDDGDACTSDSCDPSSGAIHTPIDCNDNNPCTSDSCDPRTGCVHEPLNADDGNACTNDSCDPSSGAVHTPVDCGDGNACTEDSCDPSSGCHHDPIGCDDGNTCTDDSCDPSSGCVNEPIDPPPAGCGACTGKMGDFVWDDQNQNGIQEFGEPGIEGVKVVIRNGSGDVIAVTITDANGHYEFDGLCGGEYAVEVDPSTLPAGFQATICGAGADPAVDSNCAPAHVTLTGDAAVDLTIDFGFHTQTLGSEGCSPGYWKNHPQSWAPTGYTTSQSVVSVFSGTALYPNIANATLAQALRFKGGPTNEAAARILIRSAVAALLNTAHPGVDYPRSTSQLISQVNTALASNDRATMLALYSGLDRDNNRGCPLN